jgi:hypothetical protein
VESHSVLNTNPEQGSPRVEKSQGNSS